MSGRIRKGLIRATAAPAWRAPSRFGGVSDTAGVCSRAACWSKRRRCARRRGPCRRPQQNGARSSRLKRAKPGLRFGWIT